MKGRERAVPGSTFVIIPVHNRRETTRRCLAHLRSQDIGSWAQVLVVDDGSTDGTGAIIAAEFPWVQRVAGGGDLWWAGAMHLGMRHAIAAGAECVIWLNDDTLPDAGALAELAAWAHARGAVCGGVCRGTDGRSLAYGGGLMKDGWPAPLEGVPGGGEAVGVDWLHGNLVAIPAPVWRRIGLPEWRWMRHNFSDIEYTNRAARWGMPVLLVPTATAAAQVNEGMSYRSWADAGMSAQELVAGVWQPRVWWYAPGLAAFLYRLHGVWGLGRWVRFMMKLLTVAAAKCVLPAGWVARMRACKNSAAAPRESAYSNPS